MDIEKLRADFQEKVIRGKCQPQYVMGIPEIEALFAEIDSLEAQLADCRKVLRQPRY